ncbi:hypothetical protein Sm713_01580 [Streptomyces sp. TS71-3]|nr:hypothetical protein Sm713_01580 [Streptomyces sp. TS71-3]
MAVRGRDTPTRIAARGGRRGMGAGKGMGTRGRWGQVRDVLRRRAVAFLTLPATLVLCLALTGASGTADPSSSRHHGEGHHGGGIHLGLCIHIGLWLSSADWTRHHHHWPCPPPPPPCKPTPPPTTPPPTTPPPHTPPPPPPPSEGATPTPTPPAPTPTPGPQKPETPGPSGEAAAPPAPPPPPASSAPATDPPSAPEPPDRTYQAAPRHKSTLAQSHHGGAPLTLTVLVITVPAVLAAAVLRPRSRSSRSTRSS